MNTSNVSRGQRFEDFVGNENVVQTIIIQIAAAKAKNKPFPHTLFTGDPGCGKTTLSNITANVMGTNFYYINGATLTKKHQLVTLLLKIETGDVILIDEIHRIDISLQELLYTVMEDFILTLPTRESKEKHHKSYTSGGEFITFNIKPFSLFGATTDSGLLSKPFLDRFKSHNDLESYNHKDIMKIIELNARKLNIAMTSDGIDELARRSKYTPRLAIARLEWVGDFKLYKQYPEMDKFRVIEAMEIKGIDSSGLGRDDRKYLSKLIPGKPVGLQALISMTGFSEETIKWAIEPYLLQSNMVVIESRGRVLQESASQYSQRIDINRMHLNLDADDLDDTI